MDRKMRARANNQKAKETKRRRHEEVPKYPEWHEMTDDTVIDIPKDSVAVVVVVPESSDEKPKTVH